MSDRDGHRDWHRDDPPASQTRDSQAGGVTSPNPTGGNGTVGRDGPGVTRREYSVTVTARVAAAAAW